MPPKTSIKRKFNALLERVPDNGPDNGSAATKKSKNPNVVSPSLTHNDHLIPNNSNSNCQYKAETQAPRHEGYDGYHNSEADTLESTALIVDTPDNSNCQHKGNTSADG